MTLYTDVDPFVCEWVRELVKQGLVSKGDVLCKSIKDLSGEELKPYTRVHLFCGIAGWDYALTLAGWPDDRPVWTGSCPCQPFSAAGKRLGKADERHIWPEMRRLIRECLPATCFGEQVASDDGCQWLAGVFADLEAMEYRVAGADLCAAGVGAPHIRQRIYWVADAKQVGAEVRSNPRFAVDRDEAASRPGPQRQGRSWWDEAFWSMPDARRRCEHGALPLVDGVSERLDAIGGYGNAIVPQVAAEFIRAYMECSV